MKSRPGNFGDSPSHIDCLDMKSNSLPCIFFDTTMHL